MQSVANEMIQYKQINFIAPKFNGRIGSSENLLTKYISASAFCVFESSLLVANTVEPRLIETKGGQLFRIINFAGRKGELRPMQEP